MVRDLQAIRQWQLLGLAHRIVGTVCAAPHTIVNAYDMKVCILMLKTYTCSAVHAACPIGRCMLGAPTKHPVAGFHAQQETANFSVDEAKPDRHLRPKHLLSD